MGDQHAELKTILCSEILPRINDHMVAFSVCKEALNYRYKYDKRRRDKSEYINKIVKHSYMSKLEWLHLTDEDQLYVYKCAVVHLNIDVINFATENKFKYDESVLKEAVKGDNLDIVKYLLRDKYCKEYPEIYCYDGGDFDEFDNRFKYESQYYDINDVINIAINNRNIEMIKTLHLEGQYSFNKTHFRKALSVGDINIIKYLCDKGCPYDLSICIKYIYLYRTSNPIAKVLNDKLF